MSFKEEMNRRVGDIEKTIQAFLPEETGFQKTVMEAMNYSVLAGGKRLRPLLMSERLPAVRADGKGAFARFWQPSR